MHYKQATLALRKAGATFWHVHQRGIAKEFDHYIGGIQYSIVNLQIHDKAIAFAVIAMCLHKNVCY